MHPASPPSLAMLVHERFPKNSFSDDFSKAISLIDRSGREILASMTSENPEIRAKVKERVQVLTEILHSSRCPFEDPKISERLILCSCGVACLMAAFQTAKNPKHSTYETTRNTLYNTLELLHSLKQDPDGEIIAQGVEQILFSSSRPPQCFFRPLDKLFPNTFLFDQVQEELKRTYELARDLFSKRETSPNLFKSAQKIFHCSDIPFQNLSKEEQFKFTFLIACLLAARRLQKDPSQTYDKLIQKELEEFIKVRSGQASWNCNSLYKDPFWEANPDLLKIAQALYAANTEKPGIGDWLRSHFL